MSHLISFNLHLLAQQSEVHKFFTFDPVTSAWLLVPGMLLVAASIFYLYRAGADRLAAAGGRLTVIRVLLILLVFGLLLRPLWVWRQTSTLPQTVWILADQSLSMGLADTQATPIERLRWANATGALPADVHPSPLPRLMSELMALHGDLLSLAHRTAGGARTSDARQQQEKFVRDLKHWRQMSETTIQSIARTPARNPAMARQSSKASSRSCKLSTADSKPSICAQRANGGCQRFPMGRPGDDVADRSGTPPAHCRS